VPTHHNCRYLHYAFDLSVHRCRLTKASGDMIVVRYADDTIVSFQHEREARTLTNSRNEFQLALRPGKPG
jgi:RNA-directed DNA polymerase